MEVKCQLLAEGGMLVYADRRCLAAVDPKRAVLIIQYSRSSLFKSLTAEKILNIWA